MKGYLGYLYYGPDNTITLADDGEDWLWKSAITATLKAACHTSTIMVTEAEAEWILAHPGEDEACAGGSRQALGQTVDGQYLRVVYVPDEEGDGVFVVTAYPLAGKQLKAFRRRQRRRRR